MRHLLFPSVEQADAFVQDLQAQQAILPDLGQTSVSRTTRATSTDIGADNLTTDNMDPEPVPQGGTPEDAGAGAVKGTAVGIVAGAVVGAVATVASGGLLAVPVILGMAALGSGVGAGVGAVGGAAGVDETPDQSSVIADTQYDQLDSGVAAGGRAIAVDDSVPRDVVDAAAARHGGTFI